MGLRVERNVFLSAGLLSAGLLAVATTTSSAQMSAVTDSDSACQTSYKHYVNLTTDGLFVEARDSLQGWVEHCYGEFYSWQAFSQISSAVAQISAPDSRYLDYRQWLFKVLFLNPDSIYYCSDATGLLSTFAYSHGPRGIDDKGEAAVERYLVESGKCPMLQKHFETVLVHSLGRAYARWRDSVTDSTLTPFDTTLPSLKEIGFEALLGPNAYVPLANLPKSILGQIRVVPSITADNATLEVDLNLPATLSAELFDALGNKLRSLTDDRFLERGSRHFPIASSSLPAGSYYVRVTVPEGEVKTVRFVKR